MCESIESGYVGGLPLNLSFSLELSVRDSHSNLSGFDTQSVMLDSMVLFTDSED